ncbi:CGNR zinc finger domain-containing protein [Streptomyces pinistramenti]|uniref:CGNR zinc finger domain-containing protein n=1 Tax=Streptomyces pinistramenti TaxID=2884812 RepID=UPI001D086035|nr:ABATE domain-containing protein [Streptomyces pinistramenti]MCB5910554.1 ABATE domain-containing protein [Streptomyces pinistramenti]
MSNMSTPCGNASHEPGRHEHRLPFLFFSGRPCLDFAATRGGCGHRGTERIGAPDHLTQWGIEAGLLPDDGGAGEATERTVREACGLRESLYRAVRAKMDGGIPRRADIAEVNRWARCAPLPLALSADGRSRAWADTETVTGMLASLARDAVELLTDVDAGRLRECAGETCMVVFLDQSRTNSRRWCSMDLCGNKEKKSSFKRRHPTAR